MRRMLVLSICCSVLALALSPRVLAGEPRSLFEATLDSTADHECEIERHLEDVVDRLRRVDVSDLPPIKQARRAGLIDRLEEYAAEGTFPQNTYRQGITPIFVDDGGRACAVGDLMRFSGASALAETIARTQNFAYLPDIQTPQAAEWIEWSGLTAEECAWIQPGYACPGPGNQAVVNFAATSQGPDVLLTWEYPVPPTSLIFMSISRNGEPITPIGLSFQADEAPTSYVDENVPAGDYLYELFYSEFLVCDDFDNVATLAHHTWEFERGDVDGDGSFGGLVECLYLLDWGFVDGPEPPCMEAADVDGDGAANPLLDTIYALDYQFLGGAPPPAPFLTCSLPETLDNLGCQTESPFCAVP